MGLTSAKEVEKTRVAFENLYGSSKRAGDMMQKITDFANKTPFEFPEIADMALKLKNVA
jgi:phage tail tape-measure protein